MTEISHPDIGYGLGLRAKHYPFIFENKPQIDWFEIISENFMDTDGKPKRNLARIKEMYPIVMHGVSMSIGTVDPLNSEYMRKLKALIKWVKPAWISDHLCWTGVAHKNSHDLLPVPYTEESLKHVVARIKEVQDFLEMPIALENPSTYLEFSHSSMTEADFISRLLKESGCNLLLDVNNVYVTCFNHRIDPKEYIDSLPLNKIIQVHLSGHNNMGTHIIDTHDNYVTEEVWGLYKYLVIAANRIPNTMIEWDDHIPEFPVLLSEIEKAKSVIDRSSSPSLPRFLRKQAREAQSQTEKLEISQIKMQSAILQGQDSTSAPESWIRDCEVFPAKERLNVYINAYRFRLYEVVAGDYPALKAYLTPTIFHELVWSFVNSVESTHFNVGRLAQKLPSFIKNTLTDDFAHELCILETAISQLSDPEETVPLEVKHLEGLTPEDLLKSNLYPRAALELFAFNHTVNNYYYDVMEENPPRKIEHRSTFVVVFRHEDVVWRMDLNEQEYKILQKLFQGYTVDEALNELQEVSLENISEWFARWIRNGMLAFKGSAQRVA